MNNQLKAVARELGRRRVELARTASTREEWQTVWKASRSYPFTWGSCWTHCVEYKVDDFEAELGFWLDIVGVKAMVLEPSWAMFTGPGNDFFFAIARIEEGEASIPPDTIRMQFMLDDLDTTVEELTTRGVIFEEQPHHLNENSPMRICFFRTPHGIPVDLWDMVSETAESQETLEEEAS